MVGWASRSFSAAALSSVLASLLLARWWQALLYNPGGFREEFHALRMGRRSSLVALVLFGAGLFGGGMLEALATNLALVAVMLFLFQGLATAHGLAGKLKLATGWLVALYAVLILAPPQMVVVLSALGFADAWVDFRGRVGNRGGPTT